MIATTLQNFIKIVDTTKRAKKPFTVAVKFLRGDCLSFTHVTRGEHSGFLRKRECPVVGFSYEFMTNSRRSDSKILCSCFKRTIFGVSFAHRGVEAAIRYPDGEFVTMMLMIARFFGVVCLSFTYLVNLSCQRGVTNGSQALVTIAKPAFDMEFAGVVRTSPECNAVFISPAVAVTTAECIDKTASIISENYFGDVPRYKHKHPQWDQKSAVHPHNIGVLVFPSRPDRIHFPLKNLSPIGQKFVFVGYGCADTQEPHVKGVKRVGYNSFEQVHNPDTQSPILKAPGLYIDSVHAKRDPRGQALGCYGDSGAGAISVSRAEGPTIFGIWVGNKPITGSSTLQMNHFINLTTRENIDFIRWAESTHPNTSTPFTWPQAKTPCKNAR